MGSGGRRFRHAVSCLCIALTLSACGGGGGSDGAGNGAGTGGQTTPPPPDDTALTGTCGLRTRQDWLLARVNEWYLFPETLSYVQPTAYTTLPAYLDAITANARAQNKDRYFSYLTSIAAENAYYTSGETAGLGMRLYLDSAGRLWVSEAYEGAPAGNAGIARGAEILSIGTSASNPRTVSAILASEGTQGLTAALGPDTNGTARTFGVRDTLGNVRTVTLTKTTFAIPPVDSRVITDNGRKIGYINLRTFIITAEPALRQAFAKFKADGIDELIVDLRYNGGGLISVARTMGSLLGGARLSTDLFARLEFRPEKAIENEDYLFKIEADAIAPRRIAFIATRSTASASESVINAMRPFMRDSIALVGDNTYGKPVGQIALDRPECDDRLRLIAFQTENATGEAGYYDGLARLMERSCRARDDLQYPLGDAREDSVARAVDFLDQRVCATPIAGTAQANIATPASVAGATLTPLTPDRPSQPQRDMPGFF